MAMWVGKGKAFMRIVEGSQVDHQTTISEEATLHLRSPVFDKKNKTINKEKETI